MEISIRTKQTGRPEGRDTGERRIEKPGKGTHVHLRGHIIEAITDDDIRRNWIQACCVLAVPDVREKFTHRYKHHICHAYCAEWAVAFRFYMREIIVQDQLWQVLYDSLAPTLPAMSDGSNPMDCWMWSDHELSTRLIVRCDDAPDDAAIHHYYWKNGTPLWAQAVGLFTHVNIPPDRLVHGCKYRLEYWDKFTAGEVARIESDAVFPVKRVAWSDFKANNRLE